MIVLLQNVIFQDLPPHLLLAVGPRRDKEIYKAASKRLEHEK